MLTEAPSIFGSTTYLTFSFSGNPSFTRLSLLMHASDTSWVKIIMDGKHIEEFTLYPNTRKKLKALTDFIMTIGNSGAMSFSLNKKPLNFKGKNKQRRQFHILTNLFSFQANDMLLMLHLYFYII